MKSLFATSLARIFKETATFDDLEQWAAFLGVPETSLLDWTNDRSVPRADLLHMILDLLGHSRMTRKELLDEAHALYQKPALEISPLGALFRAPTVLDYLTASTVTAFGRRLLGLTPAEQERALLEGSWRP